ncbi:hypothetical protein Tcan_09062 [Toxocara canis]|uniref:Uncharacterized protein n=1 Tax=Toxocara canis TaxID=6265 RepID=A0A0B2VBC6_TOXCA|nr:hypothetical protein Tcan_09062 [Toxocara canis]
MPALYRLRKAPWKSVLEAGCWLLLFMASGQKIASATVKNRSQAPFWVWLRNKLLAVDRLKTTPPPGLETPDGKVFLCHHDFGDESMLRERRFSVAGTSVRNFTVEARPPRKIRAIRRENGLHCGAP